MVSNVFKVNKSQMLLSSLRSSCCENQISSNNSQNVVETLPLNVSQAKDPNKAINISDGYICFIPANSMTVGCNTSSNVLQNSYSLAKKFSLQPSLKNILFDL